MEPVRMPWAKPQELEEIVRDEALVGAIAYLKSVCRERGVDVMSVSLNYNSNDSKPNSGRLAGDIDGVQVWVSNYWD
jgi:hypothetical protein